ncbi:hypothetical protein HY493_00755 [Candidatus Woesearchaeota archaeon]|nr:hypothetical protein [Candidatus Woesearchaeota archaeon]
MAAVAILGVVAGVIAIVFAVWMALWATGIYKKALQRTEGASGAKPVTKSKLKAMLLRLNKPKHPFTLKPAKDTDLFVEWKIVDAKWIEVLGGAWLKKNYYGWLLLDDATKTARMNEMITEKSLTLAGPGAYGEASFFRGVQLFRKERGYRWGIRTDGTIGEVYNYRFNPMQLKEVLRQVCNDNGWAFELVTTKGQASFPKR